MLIFNQGFNQKISICDQQFDYVHVDGVIEERQEIVDSKSMQNWIMYTLCDNHLSNPFLSHNFLGSLHASYVYNFYALIISNVCDKEKKI